MPSVSDGPSTRPEHGIGAVEERTGVSQHVLRAWERRYAVVTPARDEGGNRLYSDADVERLRLMHELVSRGRRIGRIADLSLDELRRLVERERSTDVFRAAGAFRAPVIAGAGEHLQACLDVLTHLDGQLMHTRLMRAAVVLGPRGFVDGVAVPLLRAIGDDWESGELTPVYEHGASVALRRVLSWMLEALPAPATAPLVVCGTPSEQRHEFGAMLAGVVAAAAQWRVLYLGPDLPATEIARAAVAAHANAVALSVLTPLQPRALTDALHGLRAALPPTTSLVVGGAAATASARAVHASGAKLLRDFDAWDAWLRDDSRHA